jgi:3-hydroxyisobutyrate dehydrogenase-like beta-hydroxyacid dehydrogenase
MGAAGNSPWGFIGLGEMGDPMVASLLAGGLEVIAFDVDSERLAHTGARGAATAAGVAELARAAPVVSVCVRDAADLDAVIDGGLAAAAGPETIVLVHSTVGRDACRTAAARLAERGAGLLDAPVSGMRMAAGAGSLAFFVGGRTELLASVRRGLEAMGRAVVHVGDVGAGQVVKIANNLIAFASAGVVHEAVSFARAAGVDEERLLEALSRGSARSWVVENWRFLRDEWVDSQPGGAAAVQAIIEKDLSLAVTAAEAVAVDAPMAAVAAGVVPGILSGRR